MKLFKLAALSLTVFYISLLSMNPCKTEKVKQYSKVLKKLSAEDKSTYKTYFNCIPDIQRIIKYYSYLRALDEVDSLDKHYKLLLQIRELKQKYNDSPTQQHPYSFVELEELATNNKDLTEAICSRITQQKYLELRNQVAQNLADQNVKDDLMRYAVNHNDNQLIKVAAYLGADVNARLMPDCYTSDMDDSRPLFRPYLHDTTLKIATAKTLLELGADINRIGDYRGMTPLHQHVFSRNADLVKLLIERGAHVNAKDGHGDTPLFLAVFFHQANMVKMLLEAGADRTITDNDGKTIFEINPKRNNWYSYYFGDLVCSQEIKQVFDEFDKKQSNKRQKVS